jgi:ABC-type phosphate transport system substrate-binding protein
VALGLLLALCAPAARAGAVAVAVNPSVDVDDLSFAELRRIMLAERQFWTTGQPITLIVRAPVSVERTVLLENVYRMSEARYREYWVAKVFRGEASDGPRVVLSSEEALDLVSVINGAITAVDSDDVPEGLKILKIDGRLPGEEGYPLPANPGQRR